MVSEFTQRMFLSDIEQLQKDIWRNAKEHGFHEGPDNFGEKLALTHGELSEALEAYRKQIKQDSHIPEFSGMEAEFADAIIRILDTAEEFKLRLGPAILAKMKYNEGRPYKHGGRLI